MVRASRVIESVKMTTVEHHGFVLVEPAVEHFKDVDAFSSRLHQQQDSYVYESANNRFNRVAMDGSIGDGRRLSKAAFSDLCHYSKVPVRFIKQLAMHDPEQAEDVLQSCIQENFNKLGGPKSFVIDGGTDRIDGIVSEGSYAPIANAEVFDYAMQVCNGLDVSNGWACGPSMRFTTRSPKDYDVQPSVGDVVRVGMSIESAINGDMSVRITGYAERLVCTNGMLSRDIGGFSAIQHRGAIDEKVQQALVSASDRSVLMIPAMERAANHILTGDEVVQVRRFIRNEKFGGGMRLDEAATVQAQAEAANEGRASDEVSLWNFVNGVTQQQHMTGTLGGRQRIESMGLSLLHSFEVSNN